MDRIQKVSEIEMELDRSKLEVAPRIVRPLSAHIFVWAGDFF